MLFKVEQFLDKSLTYINYTNYMQEAIIAALNTRTFPNPKVGAVLVDKYGNIKSTGVHHGPGTNHAEMILISLGYMAYVPTSATGEPKESNRSH